MLPHRAFGVFGETQGDQILAVLADVQLDGGIAGHTQKGEGRPPCTPAICEATGKSGF